MKKILSFIVVLLIAILLVGNVKAKSSELEITNVEILEKSDSVKANIENYKDLNINMNTLFFNKDDYVKYKISIKNNTNNTMKIDDILDNFNSEVLETSYDIDKKELKSKEEYTFTMTIKCIKDIEEERVTINTPLNIIINYDNGKTAIIDINPNTKDNIINFFIVFILSAISLIVIITKRGKKQLLGLMLLVSLIPIGSNAVSTKKEIIINNDIKVYGKTAVFKKGVEVNKILKELAGTDTSSSSNSGSIIDINISEIRRANTLLDGFIPSEENTISTDESRIPIYAWFDNGIIYYYTEAINPLFNENSNFIFSRINNLTNIELDSIDTSNVINMRALLYENANIEELDLSNFNTSNVEDMSYMFSGCSKLENVDLSSFNTLNVKNMSCMFNYCSRLEELNLSNFNTQNVTNMAAMFQRCEQLEELDVSNFNTSSAEDMSYMFNYCSRLKELNLSNFNTQNVTNMAAMFQRCEQLEELDVSNFNTSSAEDMSYMFFGCKGLLQLDVSNFDTSNVTTMRSMFYECQKIKKLDLSKFNTSKVTTMRSMFQNCASLVSLDLSTLDTENVETMQSMFYDCTSLENLNLNKINTSNVTNMAWMFFNCSNLKELDLMSFNTSEVINMYSMFGQCESLEEIDLSNFVTSAVTDMTNMFAYCINLKTIYVGNGFDTSNVTASSNMFRNNSVLVGGNGTPFNNSYRDKTYARIDTSETPGYFTLKSA